MQAQGRGGWVLLPVLYYQRFKAESEVQRGKTKGALESEIRIAMLLLEQRPPCQTCFLRGWVLLKIPRGDIDGVDEAK